MKRIVTLAAALALVALACGDSGGGEGAAGCEVGDTDGDLVLYNWTEYIDPELVTAFQDEYGVSVTEDFYTSNEEMRSKLQAGAAGYDVIVPSDYMVAILAQDELLLELNKDAIPNLGNLDETFTGLPFDETGDFSVPYQWGTTGIGFTYDIGEPGEDLPATWGLIFDPELAGQFSGDITLLDDARETLGAALKYLGYSLNTTDEDQIAEAAQLIEDTRSRLATFDSDAFDDLLVAGETRVAHGWNGDFFAAFDGASTDDYDAYEDYGYFIPDEGGVAWVDNMAIVADAPHPCTAHTFINFILDAENGAALTNFNFYASPNEAANALVDPEILEDPSIYPTDETFERLEFIADLGEANALYEQAFDEARS